MGRILGSAYLIAQMADKNYLEKLPLLFLKFEEAGMPGFETPLGLFKNTEEFYHSVVKTRLAEEMGNVALLSGTISRCDGDLTKTFRQNPLRIISNT